MSATNTVDPSEIAKFEAMAAEWWDLNGKFKPLHMMNPVRLDYITRQIAAEFGRDLSQPMRSGLRILDIGCGADCQNPTVVGADAAERNIVARIHAEHPGLDIDYRHTTAEALAEAGEQLDAVLNMVEHVADPGYLDACETVKPGGIHLNHNRNPKSCDGDCRC